MPSKVPDNRSPREKRRWQVHKTANELGEIITPTGALMIADFTEDSAELDFIVGLVVNVARKNDALDWVIAPDFVAAVLARLAELIDSARPRQDRPLTIEQVKHMERKI